MMRNPLRPPSVSKRFYWQKLRELLPGAILPLLCFGLVLSILLRNSIVSLADKQNRAKLLQTMAQIEQTIEEIDSLNLTFGVNYDIVRTLTRTMQHDSFTARSIAEMQKLITHYLIPTVAARPYIESVYIYQDNPYGRFLTDTNYLVTLDSYYDTSWFDSYCALDVGYGLHSEVRTLQRYSFEKDRREVITLYKRLYMRNGAIIMNLFKAYFDAQLKAQAETEAQQYIVFNDQMQVVMQSHEDPWLLNADILNDIMHGDETLTPIAPDGEKCQITHVVSPTLGWHYISITPLNTLYALPNRLMTYVLMGSLFTVLLCSFLATRYAKRSHASLMMILHALQASKDGHEMMQYIVPQNDLYSQIMQNIIANYTHQNALQQQIAEHRNQAKVRELTALRSQIHPHFLINTLQSIYWMSYGLTESSNEVSRMIEHMTAILEYSMETKDRLVPLALELSNTRAYIALQHMRYQNRFTVAFHIDESLLHCFTLKLILQPLVENAIMHGIDWESDEALSIAIFIQHTGQTVHVAVEDNGLGITDASLIALQQNLDCGEESDHIGLLNCHRRLQLTFGISCGLVISNEKGFRVDFAFPMILDDAQRA